VAEQHIVKTKRLAVTGKAVFLAGIGLLLQELLDILGEHHSKHKASLTEFGVWQWLGRGEAGQSEIELPHLKTQEKLKNADKQID